VTAPRRTLLAAAAGLAAAPRPGAAEDRYPSRAVRVIVPFAPGGSSDLTARFIAGHMEARTGQPAVVDNRAGANGVIGTVAVKQAAPDGYTLLLATTTTMSANPALLRNLPYDPAKDFTTVGFYASSGAYLLVRPDAPWRDVPALVADAGARPGELFFGHFNASSRVPAEVFNALAGVRIQGVPYRAIGAAFADLLAGRLHLIFVDTVAGDAWVRDGRLRALATTRERRLRWRPDLPAMSESYPEFGMSGFLGMAAPAGTPRAVCERLNALCNEAMTTEPAKGKLVELGFEPEAHGLDRIAELVEAERGKWAGYVRLAGIEPE
jgi:tripartite-type tricarboxylate transporter receptor subunit TctC